MFKLRNLGCFGFFVIVPLALFFAKFLIPIIPILIVVVVFYYSKEIKATLFTSGKSLHGLAEGSIKLEGKATVLDEQILSPYFNEPCIGFQYTEEESVPTSDGYNTEILSQKKMCKDFTLTTKTGTIKINADRIKMSDLEVRKKTVHSLTFNVNDITHVERILKNDDEVVIIGDVMRKSGRLEIAKLENNAFFVTTKSKIEGLKVSYQIFLQLMPWAAILYLTVNYFLFFAPIKEVPKNDAITYFFIFGLPILFIVFWLIGKEGESFPARIFQYLASVCIITSILSFPLLIVFHMIELAYYRIFCIMLSILAINAIMILVNSKQLTALNDDYKKTKKPNTKF